MTILGIVLFFVGYTGFVVAAVCFWFDCQSPSYGDLICREKIVYHFKKNLIVASVILIAGCYIWFDLGQYIDVDKIIVVLYDTFHK